MDFQVGAGLIPLEPDARALIALFLDFASEGALTPAAFEFRLEGQAHAAIVSHVATAINDYVDVIGIIQGFGATPDHGEGHYYVWGSGRVGEFGLVAVDRVCQQSSVDTGYATLDVELAHESRLNNELLEQNNTTSNLGLSLRLGQGFRDNCLCLRDCLGLSLSIFWGGPREFTSRGG